MLLEDARPLSLRRDPLYLSASRNLREFSRKLYPSVSDRLLGERRISSVFPSQDILIMSAIVPERLGVVLGQSLFFQLA
jgi:hypothetical protein